MTNVLSLATGKAHDKTNMLDVLDSLRKQIDDGEIVAFVAAGLDSADNSFGWASSVGGVTRLRMMGAIANLQYQYQSGALSDSE